MKYLDVLLKAASIALFIANISNTISIIAFALYCLFQQSGVSFFSYGTPKNMMHKAQDMEDIDNYIHQYFKDEYTIAHITEALLSVYPDSRDNPYTFVIQAKFYKNYLSYMNIQPTIDVQNNQVQLNSNLEAIAYETFFMHKKHLSIPNKYMNVFRKAHMRPARNLTKSDDSQHIIIGYPRHLQLGIIHTTSPKIAPEIDIMLQIGNQYKFRAKMLTRAAQYYGLALLSAFSSVLSPIAILPTCILLVLAIRQHQPEDFVTLNIGFDPRSSASSLYSSSPDTSTIVYSLGAILLNILVNVLFFASFSLLGAINILNFIPMYVVIGLTLFTLYDRLLMVLELNPWLKKPITKVFVNSIEKPTSTEIIYEPKPCGFNIPTSISSCIRACHYKTYQLTHLL